MALGPALPDAAAPPRSLNPEQLVAWLRCAVRDLGDDEEPLELVRLVRAYGLGSNDLCVLRGMARRHTNPAGTC